MNKIVIGIPFGIVGVLFVIAVTARIKGYSAMETRDIVAMIGFILIAIYSGVIWIMWKIQERRYGLKKINDSNEGTDKTE